MTNRMNQALVVTRAAADAQDKVKAVGALTALSSIVTREARAGHLSDAHERALRTGIAQARRRIELDVEASQPAPSVQPPPAKQQPAPVAPGPAKGRGKGNGKSKGKG
ncbi:MAG TPA: hypothetical protein VNA28_17740 [Solirubrobacteraceae bacterium]|nr:hypothetical protein [Solirubrobacteraceae bacterium]